MAPGAAGDSLVIRIFGNRDRHRQFRATWITGISLLLIVLIAVARERAQSSPAASGAAQMPEQQGTVATSGAHTVMLDSENRPITAGGFVDSGPIVFQDIAEKAGLTS